MSANLKDLLLDFPKKENFFKLLAMNTTLLLKRRVTQCQYLITLLFSDAMAACDFFSLDQDQYTCMFSQYKEIETLDIF